MGDLQFTRDHIPSAELEGAIRGLSTRIGVMETQLASLGSSQMLPQAVGEHSSVGLSEFYARADHGHKGITLVEDSRGEAQVGKATKGLDDRYTTRVQDSVIKGEWTFKNNIILRNTQAGSPRYIHIQSRGDAYILLEADTDNIGEADNSYIKFSQDNGLTTGLAGFLGVAGLDPEGNVYANTLENAFLLGTLQHAVTGGLQFGVNSAVAMTILPNLHVGIGLNNPAVLFEVGGVARMNLANVWQFRDPQISIGSLADGHLDLTADLSVDINAPTLLIGDGAFNAPGIAFIADTDTGIYRAGADSLVIQAGTGLLQVQAANTICYQPFHMRTDNEWIGFGSGTGAGAPDATIYYNATNLVIDPDVIGAGRVLIGATADDILGVAQIEMTLAGQIQFRDPQLYWASLADGHLDGAADVSIDLNTPRTYISGTLGIGTETVPHGGVGWAKFAIEGTDGNLAGPHVQITTDSDDYPLFHMLNWQHDNIRMMFDAYYNGAWRSSDVGSNYLISKQADELRFEASAGTAAGGVITWTESFFIGSNGNIRLHTLRQVQFRDAQIHLASLTDGHLDATFDVSFDFNGPAAIAPDNFTFGLAAGGHIEWDDQAIDEINFIDCNVGINTQTPAYRLDVNGTGRFVDQLDCDSDVIIYDTLYVDEISAIKQSPMGMLWLNGWTKLGDVDNYLAVEDDGSQEWLGAATMWDDANLGAIILERGAAAPDIVNISASTLRAPAFDGNATTEQLSGTLELPHSWREGSNVTPHVHWMPTTANAGNAHWQLEYEVLTPGATAGAGTTITVTIAASGVAWQELRTDFPVIAMVGNVTGTQIAFRLFRDPTDGADTYGDDAAVLTFGIHFEMDRPGSRQIATK